MRRLGLILAITLIVTVAVPLRAQRSGSGFGGGIGGMRGASPVIGQGGGPRSAQTSRVFAPHTGSVMPSAGMQRLPNLRYPTPRRMRNSSAFDGYPVQHQHAAQYDHGHDHSHGHGQRYPYVFAYNLFSVPNVVGYPFGFGSLFDSFGSDDSGTDNQEVQDQSSEPQPGYPESYPGDEPSSQAAEEHSPEPPPPDAAENIESDTSYRPAYKGELTSQPVRPQPATTLIFVDGRPSEQVHNYIITKTILYNLDGDTRREISLSALDLPATIEANRSAGIDFALPAKP